MFLFWKQFCSFFPQPNTQRTTLHKGFRLWGKQEHATSVKAFIFCLSVQRYVSPDSLFLPFLLPLHFSPFSSGLLPIQKQISLALCFLSLPFELTSDGQLTWAKILQALSCSPAFTFANFTAQSSAVAFSSDPSFTFAHSQLCTEAVIAPLLHLQ